MSDHYEYPYPSTELESRYPFHLYDHQRLPEETMTQRALAFFEEMNQRRSIRMFSPDTVPIELIELAVQTASTAPSGAHKQPWTFIATQNSEIKKAIREAAEEEERTNYLENRMNADWQQAIAPLGTDYHKEFLEIAPWLVVLFEQRYEITQDGSQRKNYYVKESVGIAAGLFIASLHRMGLSTLTHTPSPMKFLNQILERPVNERPFCVFPIGYPLDDVKVPDIQRKELDEILHIL